MLSKRLVFALILLVLAISSVSASDFNSTDADYGQGDSSLEVFSQNSSGVLVSESDEGLGLADTSSDVLTAEQTVYFSQNSSGVLVSESDEGLGLADMSSDVLAAGQTVYFNASASTDGVGTQSSPYKYLKTDRITSGMTAYFANGVYVYSGSATIGSKVTFIGQSKANTIIRSTSTYSFDLSISSGSSLVLKDLTFDYGHIINRGNVEANNVAFKNSVCYYSDSSSYFGKSSCGGVIFSESLTGNIGCTVNLKNCYFEGNEARHGGVIAANYTNIIITNCIFDNSVSGRSGGVIYSINSNLTVSKSSFNKNNAKYGGAIYSENGDIKLTDSNFTTSSAYSYGGVVASIKTTSTVTNCNFLNYKSITDSGGAIYADRGLMAISQSSFTNGVADFGGAICALNIYATVTYSNFQNNTGNYGGAIFNMYRTLDISNSYFKDSTAKQNGGAICSYLADCITLTNNVFVNSNNMYIISKSTTQFTKNGNSGLTNIGLINTTVFDLSSDSIVPIINYSPKSSDTIPSAYDSRDYGYVTPIKNQMDGGTCWAFAAIATLEVCLKKATGISYDFSEENFKNLIKVYSLFGKDKLPNSGANDKEVFAYFTSWMGPVYDYIDVYDDYSALSPIYYPLFHIQNIICLPTRQSTDDNDIIKRAIMDYGAVAASTFWTSAYHSICIVGWDDNFNRADSFGNYAEGAWIVKNSWGENSGDAGYYYISYQRDLMSETHDYQYVYTFCFNDDEGYFRNYQYDASGTTSFFESSSDDVSYKNIFVSKGDEVLSAFSTFFKEPTKYSVSLYVGNNLILTQEGSSSAGYYTIPFKTKTTLSKGDKFTIVIKNLNTGKKYVPVCRAIDINLDTLPSGVSYVNIGNGWKDLYSYYATPRVASIKAFTTPVTLNQVTLSANTFTTVNVDDDLTINFKLSNTQLNRGFVTVKINDKTYYASVSNGQASLKLRFDSVGSYAFSAEYRNNLYASNIISFNFNVVKNSGEISISAPDLTKYYGASDKFAIRVTNGGSAVSGAAVKFIKGSSTLTVTTNSNGYAYVDVDWAPGSYDVRSEYEGKSVSSKITVMSTIDVSDLSYTYGASYVKATFYNADGSALSNTLVKFKIGNLTYTDTTTSNGFALAVVKLDVGTYTVDAINPVNNEIKSFKLTINKAYSSVSLSTSQNGDLVTLTASLSPATVSGQVIFTVGGNHVNFTKSISDGKSNLVLNLSEGTYPAYVTFLGNNNYYSYITSTIYFNVVPATNNIVISAPDLTKYYGDSKYFAIRVTDNGQAVSGAAVKYIRGTKTLTLTTDDDGYAYVDVNLAPGTYYIRSEYGGKSVSSIITIKSTISASAASYAYGSEILKATFYNTDGSPLSNTQVKFKIGNNVYTTSTSSNGVANYYAITLNVDTYTVTAVNTVTNEEKAYTLTVTKNSPTIFLSSTQSDGLVTITVGLSHSSATGNVIFTIGSNLVNFTREISNGKATLTLTLNDGTYNVYATYGGNDNLYSVRSSTMSVTVSSQDKIVVSAPDLTKYYGSSNRFSIRVTDNGQAVSGASVKFVRGSHTLTVTTNSNGYAYVDVDWAPGTYVVQSEYAGKSVLSMVTVKSTISASDLTYNYGGAYLKARFYNTDGSPLSNTQVKFKKGSITYFIKTDSNGYASRSVSYNVGNYTIDAINPVNNETKSFKVTINRALPTITLTSSQSSGTITITATLSPASSGGNVTFTVGSNLVNYTRSVTSGKATLTLTLKDGSYPAYATYAGNVNLYPVRSSTKTIVFSSTPNIAISAPDLTMYYGASDKFVISVTDNGNALSGASVKFTRDDEVLYPVTNSDGYAYVGVKLTPGTYNIKCEYGGKSVSSKIIVKSTISASNADYEYGSSYLKATFYNTDGSKLANAKVKFKVGNKEYTTTTNANGLASYSIKLDVGTHTITAVNPVNNETKTFKVTVSKYSTVISVSSISKFYGDSKKLTITVRDNKGKLVASDLVTIDIYDDDMNWYDCYYLVTNSKGQVKLSCNFKPGSYSLYVEDDYDYQWADVVVKKLTPRIVAKSRAFSLNVKTKKYTMVLKTNKNVPLKNQKVTLRVLGKTYTVKTDKYGKATFKITQLKKRGTFNAIIKYAGNGYYKAINKKVKISVR